MSGDGFQWPGEEHRPSAIPAVDDYHGGIESAPEGDDSITLPWKPIPSLTSLYASQGAYSDQFVLAAGVAWAVDPETVLIHWEFRHRLQRPVSAVSQPFAIRLLPPSDGALSLVPIGAPTDFRARVVYTGGPGGQNAMQWFYRFSVVPRLGRTGQ